MVARMAQEVVGAPRSGDASLSLLVELALQIPVQYVLRRAEEHEGGIP